MRGDPAHALALLADGLRSALGGPCEFAPGATEPAPRAGLQPVPLVRLGERLGTLWLTAEADAARAEPVLATAAELLRQQRSDPRGAAAGAYAALLTAALDGADTFVWEWDPDSDRLSDIDQGLRMLGWPRGALPHTQAAWNALIHPEDLDANHAAYLRHARGETEVYEHTYRARDVHGRWRWLVERGRIVERHPDGRPRRMLGTQTDVTDRREIEAAASQAMQRMAGIARHVPGVLFQFVRRPDGSAAFPYLSERSQALFGLRPDELAEDATPMLRRVMPEDREAMRESIAASARTLEVWRVEFRVARDGEAPPAGSTDARAAPAWRWLRGEASPVAREDGAVVWYGYIEDATERRDLEHARADAAMAEAANRAKTEFLSRISHELRTPLNAVLGFTQLLEIDHAEPPGEGQKRRLKLIRNAGEHLLQMIGDLLDLTRIESGQMALDMQTLDLRHEAEAALAMLRGEAEAAGLSLLLEPAPAGARTAHVRADATRLRQVLLNLVSNAVKYNRPGGSITVAVEPALGLHWRASVRDTGVGIAEDELPRLFEPFYRGARARAQVEGSGIGLAVTQALVAAMGGHIEVQSRLGSGSLFAVTLRGAAPPGSEPAATPTRGPAAEDDPDLDPDADPASAPGAGPGDRA